MTIFTRIASAAVAMIVGATQALAAVSITPTTIALGPERMTALITITNESDRPARFETSLNAWQESADGGTVLAPSTDVLVFPQMISLQPREVKKVRVGTELAPGAAERSYRLILQELPQFNRDNGEVQIEVLSKISLPIFVTPRGVQPKATVDGPVLRDGILSFDVGNAGGSHFVLRQVEVIGRSGPTDSFNLNERGWYVLSGGRKTYRVALAAADCQRSSEILIRAVGNMLPVETRVPVQAGACGEQQQSQFQKPGISTAPPS